MPWRSFRDLGVNALNHEETFCQTAYDRGFLPTRPVNPAESAAISQILDAALGNAESYLNLVNTTCEQAAKSAYTDVVNKVYIETITGIKDYNTAIRHTVKSLAKNGLAAVTYCRKDGKKINYPVDAAVRRNIITSVGQTVGKMQLARAEEWGCNYMEVTSHFGARPSHAEWQGQVYMINGSSAEYKNLAEATGYGTGEGLKGWNCRHDMYPFIPGFSVRGSFPVDLKKNEEEYKLTQKQRTLEREVRQLRRECVVSDKFGSKTEFAQKSLELKGKERELREFIEKTERTQAARISTAGYNHSVSGKAAWAVKKSLTNSKYNDTLNIDSITITNKAINSIQSISFSTLNQVKSLKVKQACQSLLKMAAEHETGTECSIIYSFDMIKEITRNVGEKGKVRIPYQNEPYISLHNHPSGYTIGVDDLMNTAYRPNEKILIVVGNNGNTYAIEKLNNFDGGAFDKALRLSMIEYFGAESIPKIKQMYQQGKIVITPDDLLNMVEEILVKGEQYGFKYHQTNIIR